MKKVVVLMTIAIALLAGCSPDSSSSTGSSSTGSAPSWMSGTWSGRIKISGDVPTTYEDITFRFTENGLQSTSGLDYDDNITTSITSTGCTVRASGTKTISGMRSSYSATYRFTRKSDTTCSFSGTETGRATVSGHSETIKISLSGTLKK